MSLWNYIGEFFLFRWIFDKFQKSNREHNVPTTDRSNLIVEDFRDHIVNDSDETDSIHDTITTAYDYDNGDYDEVDDLDDLDIFMQNNPRHNSPHIYQGYTSRYDYPHNWDAQNYEQSFNDFHEEQDDYYMMEDF